MKKYRLVIKSDDGDNGDYVTSEHIITEAELDLVKILAQEEIKVCPNWHNYPTVECVRNKTVYDYGVLHKFKDLVPDTNTHTIKNILVTLYVGVKWENIF